MLSILAITTPIYLLITLGFVAIKTKYVALETTRSLGMFVLRVCMPAMVISAVNREGAPALNWHFLACYGAASLALLSAGITVMRLRGRSIPEASMFALGMCNSNSGFMGYPIAALVVGGMAIDMLAWALMVENLLTIPLAIAIADAGMYANERFTTAFIKAIKGLYKNPIFVGLGAGLVIKITGLPIPDVIGTVLGYLTYTAPVVALFVVGGTVASFPVKRISGDTALITFGKLFLHPALMFVAFTLFPAGQPEYILGAMLFASVPMLSIYPIFGQRYGIESITATTLVFTTTISFFTVSALIYLLG